MECAWDVVVAGHICLDITPQFPATMAGSISEVLLPGRLVNVGPATICTGGAVSNTGLNLTRLGLRTRLMGKIGDDVLGQCVQSVLRQYGQGEGLLVTPGEQTSYSVVIAPPGVDRIFLHNPGANDTFGYDDIDFPQLAQARLFHLGYPPLMRRLYQADGTELIEIFQRVKDEGLTTSLDMTLPDTASESGRVDWRALLAKLLPYVDIPLFSAEEAMFMLDAERFARLKDQAAGADPINVYQAADFAWLADELIKLGAAVAVIKCGHKGMLLRTADVARIARMGHAGPESTFEWAGREIFEEIFRVEPVVSATGSGDASIAGFLAALLRGHAPESCLKIACCVGAQCVQAVDALSGVRSWEETLRLTQEWPKRRQELADGWAYSGERHTWFGARDSVARVSP